tara:strand:+ start:236 stop:625 length:390 start_codon:yes stop_codon:yes gene_type:complete
MKYIDEVCSVLSDEVERCYLRSKDALQSLMEQALQHSDGKYLFPRYVRAGKCKADHASAALGKWLKKDFDGLTAYCLRHTFRDRLRAVECPSELTDQIGGWSTIQTIGSNYGKGYDIRSIKKFLYKILI